jgi:hypothetical protein
MQAETQLVKKRIPLCGALSVIAPALGVAVARLADVVFVRHAPPDQGFELMAYVALPLIISLLCGIVLAAVAAIRDERYSVLRWLGFLVNAGPLFYVFVGSHYQR